MPAFATAISNALSMPYTAFGNLFDRFLCHVASFSTTADKGVVSFGNHHLKQGSFILVERAHDIPEISIFIRLNYIIT